MFDNFKKKYDEKYESLFDELDKEEDKLIEYYDAKKPEYIEKYSKLSTKKLKSKRESCYNKSDIAFSINDSADDKIDMGIPGTILSVLSCLAGAATLTVGAMLLCKDSSLYASLDQFVQSHVGGLFDTTEKASHIIGGIGVCAGASLTCYGLSLSKKISTLVMKLSKKAEIENWKKSQAVETILEERGEIEKIDDQSL